MIEAGEPSTWVQQYAVRSVVLAPPGAVMVALPEVPRYAKGRAKGRSKKRAARGSIKAGAPKNTLRRFTAVCKRLSGSGCGDATSGRSGKR
jgi:hypothetical protein